MVEITASSPARIYFVGEIYHCAFYSECDWQKRFRFAFGKMSQIVESAPQALMTPNYVEDKP